MPPIQSGGGDFRCSTHRTYDTHSRTEEQQLMQATGGLIAYVAKNKEFLVNVSDFVSFLLLTPQISEFMASGLATKVKYMGLLIVLGMICLGLFGLVYAFLHGDMKLALISGGVVIFYAIFSPGTLREHWALLNKDSSVPILRESLLKMMFFWGFLLFGLSRAIGILSVIVAG
jgi:hypothetical protein